METCFQVRPAHLAVNAGNKLSRRSLYVQSSLGMSSALFKSLVTKALDVYSSSVTSPSAVAKMVYGQRKESRSKDVKKSTEGMSSGNDNINVNLVQAEVS